MSNEVDPKASARVLLVNPDATTARAWSEQLAQHGDGRLFVILPTDSRPAGRYQGDARDVAVIHVRAGGTNSRMITDLREAGWQRTLAVIASGDDTAALAALQAGATGLLVAGSQARPREHSPSAVHDLSTREIEVLTMVADGRSNIWIGEHLGLSALTVKSHLARIGRKLGTGERAHMVAMALRAGVIN